MSKIIIITIITILLMGCDNSMKQARARSRNAATNRANDKHNAAMADSRALTPVRLIVKEVLLWALMASGVLIIISVGGASGYFVVGASIAKVKQFNIMLVPMDRVTRQYPLLVSNGTRAYVPGTGERNDLRLDQSPRPQLTDGSHAVQLSGVRFSSYQEYEQKLLRGGE